MRFLTDPPLGKLARWLRVLGYDTLYYRQMDPRSMMARARKEDRVILTRATSLKKRLDATALPHLFVRSDHLGEQLREVIQAFSLPAQPGPFSLCLVCNERLHQVAKEDVEGQVPDFVYETQPHFVRCPRCRRVYWPGTHRQRMEEKIRTWLEE
ncbi:MAG: Mut7-C RNAse domain-containing protein [Candidatus Tectomicrobia bacterium]|uniref:Mut7-C RNAse domain-containing protein n=1 Tax=Tectimicrobiota bacterium TaxID=2528274 RepID=A0A932CM43_UNCTE|nr:Mut7-C RNAse domain-containing protein [Candidatus Tectomicrobia bacterium]